MKRIIKTLEEENPTISLTENCDIVCKACPNKANGKCLTHCKVNIFDNACLQQYNLNYGDIINWQQLKYLAYTQVINKGLLSTVCKNCQWKCWEYNAH